MAKLRVFEFAGQRIGPGERCDVELVASQSYSGRPVVVPLSILRAEQPGPTVFVTAALHGDELNGTGIVRELILRAPFDLSAGTLILAPVLNILGFERQLRYLPDRRDLNRCFPGSAEGSLAKRFAHAIFQGIVRMSDFGIDLHTAARGRTNYPNVRVDFSNEEARRVATAFGCELIVDGKGPVGSLRRSACAAGCATFILEAGEVGKIEPGVVEYGVRGISNVLAELGMVKARRYKPPYRAHITDTTWIRADHGGMLEFHVAPGQLMEKEQPIATVSTLLGKELAVISAPNDGVVLGMTTLPVVAPGDPVCHLAEPPGGIEPIRRILADASDESLHERVRDHLATSFTVSEPNADAD